MQHEWILDVLADLRCYAVSNELAAVAEQLEDARLTAMAEIASAHEGKEFGLDQQDPTSRGLVAPFGASRRA